MRIRRVWTFALAGASTLAFAGVSLSAPSALQTMQDLEASARQVRAAAVGIELLAKEPDAQWNQFDKQWKLIKPAQDRVNVEIGQLQAVKSSLTRAQQKALDRSEKLAQDIAARTRTLHNMLNAPNMLNTANLDNQSSAFRTEAEKLAAEARQLARDAHTAGS